MAHLATLPAGYIHGFFISLWVFLFGLWVVGGKSVFSYSNNFLQPNADLPYKQILKRFLVFQASISF